MMDFGALPPEINSARMYSGPGVTPLMTATAAWRELAAELDAAATSFQSVIAWLVGEHWMGPAAATMAAAVTPYVAWMSITADQAEQVASQAAAAAAAFETAHAATVAPPMIAANRGLLATLVAGNVLGHNTTAIAATEAHYGQMWAQDASAMFSYANSSATATKLTPYTVPPQITNPAGPVGQGGAVSQAAGAVAGSRTQSTLSELTSAMPTALQGLASPLQSGSSEAGGTSLAGILNGLLGADGELGLNADIWNTLAGTGMFNVTQVGADIAAIQAAAVGANLGLDVPPGPVMPALAGAGIGSVGQASPTALGGAGVSASLGQASPVGGLSVPPSWAAATPASAGTAAGSGTGWAVSPESKSMAAVPAGMPGGAGGRSSFGAPRYGVKPTVMPRPVVIG